MPDIETTRHVRLVVAVARNRSAGKIHRASITIKHHLDYAFGGKITACGYRRNGRSHRPARILRQFPDQPIDKRWIDERLVALNIHQNIIIGKIPCRASNAVRTAGQFARRHHRLAAVLLHRRDDTLIVCGDQHLIKRFRLFDRLHHPRHQRLAGNHRQRLARETRRAKSAWNYSIYLHVAFLIFFCRKH